MSYKQYILYINLLHCGGGSSSQHWHRWKPPGPVLVMRPKRPCDDPCVALAMVATPRITIRTNNLVDIVARFTGQVRVLSSVISRVYLYLVNVQGDTSGCAKPPVDFKTKVLLWPAANSIRSGTSLSASCRFPEALFSVLCTLLDIKTRFEVDPARRALWAARDQPRTLFIWPA